MVQSPILFTNLVKLISSKLITNILIEARLSVKINEGARLSSILLDL